MAEKLKIIPLGGLDEIGKNCTVLEYGKDMIVIDCGVAFPGPNRATPLGCRKSKYIAGILGKKGDTGPDFPQVAASLSCPSGHIYERSFQFGRKIKDYSSGRTG